MNLFERLMLRRLMNVAGEGGEGGGRQQSQQKNNNRSSSPAFLIPVNQQGSNRANKLSSRNNNRRPRRLLKNCLTMATKKAGRIFMRSWGARKKLKTTVLSHRKAATGHF